jgi:peptidyl-prolyl cis-trans isomerase D
MLEALRHFGNTWYGKIFFGILMVGLAGFGVSDVWTTLGSTDVATIGGNPISQRDFQRAYTNALNAVARQTGQMPTQQQALAYGVPSMVLNDLISKEAVNKLGEDIGLGVSDDKLGEILRSDPTFSGTLGSFDRANFQRILQQGGYTEAEYFGLQTDAARRQQIAAGLFAGTAVPQAALELIGRYTGDRRSIDYFVMNAESLPSVATPTEDELAAYLKDHQDEYRTRETRTVDVMVLSLATLAPTETVTEDEIAAEYERTKEHLVNVEKREIRQIALTTPEQEKAFTDGKAAGKTMDQLLAETGLTAENLGVKARSEISDTQLADAAFGLALDDYAIIPGIGGKRAITVTEIRPGGQITLAEAHDDIRTSLQTRKAREDFPDILDGVETQRATFKPLREIADQFKLTVETVAVTSDGGGLADAPDVPEDQRGKVAGQIFDADEGDLTPTVTLSSTASVWFDLKDVAPVRDQTLAEVHDAVADAWTKQKTDEALTARVNEALAALKAGKPIDDVATSANQFAVLSQPFTRNGDGTSVIDQTVAQAVFNGSKDHFGSAVNGDGDHVVFQVVDVTPAAGPPDDQEKQYVENGTRDSLYAEFVGALQGDVSFHINQTALEQIIGTPAGQ